MTCVIVKVGWRVQSKYCFKCPYSLIILLLFSNILSECSCTLQNSDQWRIVVVWSLRIIGIISLCLSLSLFSVGFKFWVKLGRWGVKLWMWMLIISVKSCFCTSSDVFSFGEGAHTRCFTSLTWTCKSLNPTPGSLIHNKILKTLKKKGANGLYRPQIYFFHVFW